MSKEEDAAYPDGAIKIQDWIRLRGRWLEERAVSKEEDEAYLARMLEEPTVHGILRWLEEQIRADGCYDSKYLRRLIEALIVVKGGTP